MQEFYKNHLFRLLFAFGVFPPSLFSIYDSSRSIFISSETMRRAIFSMFKSTRAMRRSSKTRIRKLYTIAASVPTMIARIITSNEIPSVAMMTPLCQKPTVKPFLKNRYIKSFLFYSQKVTKKRKEKKKENKQTQARKEKLKKMEKEEEQHPPHCFL